MARARAEDVAEKLKDAFSAWDSEHLERYLAMLDPGFEVHDPMFPEPVKGKEAVRRLNEPLLQTFPDIQFKVLGMAAAGDVVAGEMTLSFTFNSPLALPQGTIPPTGRRLEVTYAAFYRFNSEGLLTSVHNYGLDLGKAVGS
jgi:predicted ester cyclase